MAEARCIICGCTDARACPGGCSWIWVDRRRQRGLCSLCGPPGDEMVDGLTAEQCVWFLNHLARHRDLLERVTRAALRAADAGKSLDTKWRQQARAALEFVPAESAEKRRCA